MVFAKQVSNLVIVEATDSKVSERPIYIIQFFNTLSFIVYK